MYSCNHYVMIITIFMNINTPYESCGSRNNPYQEIVLLYSGQYTLYIWYCTYLLINATVLGRVDPAARSISAIDQL